jgi:hypothetical protein
MVRVCRIPEVEEVERYLQIVTVDVDETPIPLPSSTDVTAVTTDKSLTEESSSS